MGPSWAILGVSWATLGHLGTKSFQDPSRMAVPVPRDRHLSPFWTKFRGPKFANLWLFLGSYYGPVFGHCLEHFWANFGDFFWDQMGLRRAKMGSKRPTKSFKGAKTCICKNLEKHYVFHGFWVSKAVQDSLGRPKKAPKRRLKSSKGFKKVDPKIEPILITFWITFGALLGPILG